MQTATPLDVALARARVLLVGVGGLGAPAAAALAAAGVGVLGLIDPDVVELSNLHRQPLYESGDLGRPKVDVAAARLRARTPQLRVETWRTRFGPDHGELARSFDVVLDGTDTIGAKFVVNDATLAAGVPLVHAGVLGFRAQLLTVLPGRSACYRCLFDGPPPPEEILNCQQSGILGAVAGTLGTIQATEAVKYLAGFEEGLLTDRLLTYDAKTMKFHTIEINRNPECAACGAAKAADSISSVPA